MNHGPPGLHPNQTGVRQCLLLRLAQKSSETKTGNGLVPGLRRTLSVESSLSLQPAARAASLQEGVEIQVDLALKTSKSIQKNK